MKGNSLPKKLLYLTSTLGLLLIIFFTALSVGFYAGWVTPENLRRIIKYNPLVTSSLPIVSESLIQTNFYSLLRREIALPSLNKNFISGGGAIVETNKGILIAEKSGRFFFLDQNEFQEPRLRLTSINIDINEKGFTRDAKKEGYAIKPGLNVGYAGLGMRLHDLLLLPDKKSLMASFTRWKDSESCAELIFALTELNQNEELPTSGTWKEVFVTTPCLGFGPQKNKPFAGHQAGGRMIKLDNETVLVTVGDFKNDGDKRSLTTANPANSYGKTHLIDLRTGRVQNNYSTGHRNPQGLVRRQNGEIWSTEHGPAGGDEINYIKSGANYGWPKVTLGKDCGGCDWQQEGRHEGYEKPRWAFIPSIGISNLIEIRDFAPLWDGDLLVSSLKAETLYRIRLNKDRPIYASQIFIGDRIRDIVQLRDSRIVLWTDTGKLIFLEISREGPVVNRIIEKQSGHVQEILKECAVCHELNQNPLGSKTGRISLAGIVGSKIGDQPGINYSEVLSKQDGYWTPETLNNFLESPSALFPGTSMAYEGIADANTRRELINVLRTLN
jgi:cytochrome c2